MQTIDVRVSPVADGWIVETCTRGAPLLFRAGGRAEARAEALAKAITAAGDDARLTILDRSGQVVGTRWFWAREAADVPPTPSARSAQFA
jgi:hypothetical protein